MIALPEKAIEPAVASARPGQRRCGRGTGVVVLIVASVGFVVGSEAMRELTRHVGPSRSRVGNTGFALWCAGLIPAVVSEGLCRNAHTSQAHKAQAKKSAADAAPSSRSSKAQERRRRAAKPSAARP